MCGIVGVVSDAPVNQLIYDALLLLQHRGQDAAGIVTQLGRKFFMHKAKGMVRDVFRTRNMRALPGNVGLGQVRYPTAGNAYSEEEAQPFYVNAPFGIVLVFIGVVFAGGLVSWLIKKMVEAVGLRPVDRALGAAFGLIRGAVLLLALAVVVNLTSFSGADWWMESKGAAVSMAALRQLKPVLPDRFGEYLPS